MPVMPPPARIADRLAALGLTLPVPPKPVAAYIPFVRSGNLVFISGQIPFRDGKVLVTGPVPSGASIEQARDAARQCALNGLAILADALGGDLDRVSRIVRLGVFVQSDPGFTDQPKVANGASELLVDLFGERGRHARAAVGSVALPLGATVEVEMVAEVAS
jgi:enamine deaminase RidA (YjgF/YER057c/UK114 family)